jgi:hypothetical protein
MLLGKTGNHGLPCRRCEIEAHASGVGKALSRNTGGMGRQYHTPPKAFGWPEDTCGHRGCPTLAQCSCFLEVHARDCRGRHNPVYWANCSATHNSGDNFLLAFFLALSTT